MLILVMKYAHKNLSNGTSYMVIEFVFISLEIMGNRFGDYRQLPLFRTLSGPRFGVRGSESP